MFSCLTLISEHPLEALPVTFHHHRFVEFPLGPLATCLAQPRSQALILQ
jgi:hypothetical protein